MYTFRKCESLYAIFSSTAITLMTLFLIRKIFNHKGEKPSRCVTCQSFPQVVTIYFLLVLQISDCFGPFLRTAITLLFLILLLVLVLWVQKCPNCCQKISLSYFPFRITCNEFYFFLMTVEPISNSVSVQSCLYVNLSIFEMISYVLLQKCPVSTDLLYSLSGNRFFK